jgi:hypothetical protein
LQQIQKEHVKTNKNEPIATQQLNDVHSLQSSEAIQNTDDTDTGEEIFSTPSHSPPFAVLGEEYPCDVASGEKMSTETCNSQFNISRSL